mgnify:CR=1 FL=1
MMIIRKYSRRLLVRPGVDNTRRDLSIRGKVSTNGRRLRGDDPSILQSWVEVGRDLMAPARQGAIRRSDPEVISTP